jgi:hypothetical protein
VAVCSVLFGALKFCGFSTFEKLAETFALAPKLVSAEDC